MVLDIIAISIGAGIAGIAGSLVVGGYLYVKYQKYKFHRNCKPAKRYFTLGDEYDENSKLKK